MPNVRASDKITLGGLKSAVTVKFIIVASVILILADWLLGGTRSPFFVIYPRDGKSLTAIAAANFLHANNAHLAGNLVGFWIFGFWALKREGAYAISGMLAGMLLGGALTWLFGKSGVVHLGFSTAVFALAGVLVISSLSSGIFSLIALCLVLGVWGASFFDTIRPTALTSAKNIGWLGHLGGVIGGMMMQARNPLRALEILKSSNLITEDEHKSFLEKVRLMYENKKAQSKTPPIPEKEK